MFERHGKWRGLECSSIVLVMGGYESLVPGKHGGNDRECGNDEMVKKAGRAGGTRPLPEGSRLGGLVTCRLEVAS